MILKYVNCNLHFFASNFKHLIPCVKPHLFVVGVPVICIKKIIVEHLFLDVFHSYDQHFKHYSI